MLDQLITAMDAELGTSALTLRRSLGSTCRAAHAVLGEMAQVISCEYVNLNINIMLAWYFSFYI